MILSRSLLAILIVCALGCSISAQTTKSAKPKNYPAIVKDSPQRLVQAEREWRRLLELYNLKETEAQFYAITHTPRSLAGIESGIKIIDAPLTGDTTVPVREAAKRFIDRWRELLSAQPGTVSLTKNDNTGGIHRLTYKQADFPFPVAGGYGEITLVINNDGRLLQLDDRFIPVVELPFSPTINRQEAAQRLVNRTFTYKDAAGNDQQLRINDLKDVHVKGLVILPVAKKDSLEIHLAWEILLGDAPSWTVYLDAIDGAELKAEQNLKN
ncbi:MAG: hypothetical protein AB1757_00670 [Acidobacteriota bacterium]